MASLKIAFDLDEVLVHLMPSVYRHLDEMYGAVRVKHDQFRIETDPPLSNTKVWKAIRAAIKDWENIEIEPRADEVMKTFYEVTERPIRVITARPLDCVEHTHRLVRHFCKVPHEIIFAGSESKMTHLLDTDAMVEDRRKTALYLAEHGKTVFLVDKPHNQIENPPKGIIRIPHISKMLVFAAMFARRIDILPALKRVQ